jgi:ferredoxin-NADP reductase
MSMPRKLRCTVESITDHGGHVYTVDLRPQGMVPGFRPGQFLHLTVDPYDPADFWPESRVFSIASSPHDRSRIRICYSVKGRYTRKMEETLQVGGTVWIKLPYGEFFVEDTSNAILVAGGTGISAFTAFIEKLGPEAPRLVTLVYGARTADLLLFQEMILTQLRRVPNFRAIFFLEAMDPGFAVRPAALNEAPVCLAGRISLEQVRLHISDFSRNVFYLSGPPAMISTLGAGLRSLGISADRIRTDAWE